MRRPLRRIIDAVKRLLRPERPGDPDDPYALVGAPKKPRPPLRRSSVAQEPEQ